MSMKNWKIWTAFTAVFATGVIVGVVCFALFLQFRLVPSKDHTAFRNRMIAHFLTRFQEEVHPDEKAMPAIRAIMEETANQLDVLRREHGPKFKAVLKASNNRIKGHLTPEQVKRFDEMIRNFRKKRPGLFRLPPPMPPPPMQ